MKIVEPSIEIIDAPDYQELIRKIEKVGRVCYKSEDKIEDGSAAQFVRGIIKRGHEAVIEHESITVKIICDRGVSHEIVRHRLASYCQESTRYCNYSNGRFGGEITVIKPCYLDEGSKQYSAWLCGCKSAEYYYFEMLRDGCTAQEARAVLPNSLKTEIVMTANIREWRHFLKLRCHKSAHPQMIEVSDMIRRKFIAQYPALFGDLEVI